MNTRDSQEVKLIVALENIKRLTARPFPADSTSYGEFLMMFVVDEMMKRKDTACPEAACPGVMISKLSDLLHISRPTASQMISALEDKGYVERLMTASDRRVVFINLTDKGKTLFDSKMARYIGILNEIIAKVGKDEVDQLIVLCDRFQEVANEVKSQQLYNKPFEELPVE